MSAATKRVSLPRQVGRLCMIILGAHAFMTGSLALFSRCSTDQLLEQHWRYSTPVLMRKRNYFRFWEPEFFTPRLTRDERECLDAWLSLLSLEAPPLLSRTWSPRVITQDSLAMLDGTGEIRDSVYALSFCVNKVEPSVLEVRREKQDTVTFLHCKTRLEVFARIPFTAFVFSVFSIPTMSTLQLQTPQYSPNKVHILAAEHRWWGGGVWSAQTGSVRSPWGDIGDLVRRYNGFIMSIMITKTATMQERVAYARAVAKAVDGRVKKLQEEQVAVIREDHATTFTPAAQSTS